MIYKIVYKISIMMNAETKHGYWDTALYERDSLDIVERQLQEEK